LTKLTERMVKWRLADYICIYQQPPQFFPDRLYQTSFYWNYFSLRSWSYHRCYGSSKVTCRTLFDLSAAVDTRYKDHSILLERLSSCIGISSTALPSIKSYLLNRSFSVNFEYSKSTPNPLYSNYFIPLFPSLVLYSSSYAPILSVLSYVMQQQTITSMLMILNFSYHS